jgi:hypothetical protein
MNDLLSWLADPNRGYPDGLALYQKYTKNKDLDFFRSAGEPQAKSMHFRMLVQKLQNVARILAENPTLIPKPDPYKVDSRKVAPITNRPLKVEREQRQVQKPVRIVDNPLVEITALPEALQQKYLQNKELYKEIAGTHAAMREAEDDEQRKGFYSELQRLEAQHASNWQEIDAWWKENREGKKPEGKLMPAPTKDPVQEAVEKVKRIDVLKTYLRRYKGKPDKQALFDKYEAELNTLESPDNA